MRTTRETKIISKGKVVAFNEKICLEIGSIANDLGILL